MDTTLPGIMLVLVAAICGGLFALPSKYAGKSSWEALWGLWFLLITVLIPIPLALLLVRGVWQTWSIVGVDMLPTMLFGTLWGVGSVMAAICYNRIGLSISYAIIPGVQVIVGPLVPLVFQQSEHIQTTHGLVVLLGMLICAAGVGVGGYAGILKQRDQNAGDELKTDSKQMNMRIGVGVCIVSGILCACFNYAFSFGEQILNIAKTRFENPEVTASLAVWAPGLLGGGIVAISYCGFLLVKNRTWRDFAGPLRTRIVILASIMGVTNWGVMIFYGWGAQLLGELGPSVGFAILFSGMLLVGNLVGFLAGEWKGTGMRSRTWIAGCMALLVLGICVLSIGNAMAEG